MLLLGCDSREGWQEGEIFSARPLSFVQLPLWFKTDEVSVWHEAMRSFHFACEGLAHRDYRVILPTPLPTPPAAHWRTLCEAAEDLLANDSSSLRFFFEDFFVPYEIRVRNQSSLLTGYYEPQLEGAREKTESFTVPLYGRPRDLLQLKGEDFGLEGIALWGKAHEGAFVPYDTRGDVMRNGLEGRAPPLAWVSNDTDAFFFAIQGSGRIVLQDGTVLRLGYAARNGHVYRSVGRAMAQRGLLPSSRLSQQGIHQFLEENSHRTVEILSINPSYIFFKELTHLNDDEGPLGSFGVPLVAGHALAVDDEMLPLGIPLWLVFSHPLNDEPMGRMMMTLDTGAAIKGALRGDIFWGTGDDALEVAGRTKTTASFFVLLPHAERLENVP